MELTHEMAGMLISAFGIILIAAAWPVPRQVQHVHSFECIEPVMLSWLMRAIGVAVFMLGIMTALSAG